MNATRDVFLERIRQAVAQGNQAGLTASHPGQWPGHRLSKDADLAKLFAERCAIVGGVCHVVTSAADAIAAVDRILTERKARRIVLGQGPHVDSLDLSQTLKASNRRWELIQGSDEPPERGDDPRKQVLYAADAGVTGVEWLVAETGSVVLASRRGQARSLSLLPLIHLAFAHRQQLLADLFDLFDLIGPFAGSTDLPSCLNLITGPSKTGDIELKLVTGVHGPGELHVLLMDN